MNSESDPRIRGERVKSLRGLRTQAWLSRAVAELGGKLSQQQIAAIEKNEAKRSGSLRELALALATSVEYLLGTTEDPQPTIHIFPVASTLQSLRENVRKRTLDVWRVTRVSGGVAMPEWVMEADAIDAVAALEGLESAKEAFAVRVPDDTIAPAYEYSDTVFIDPAAPGLPGQHVVICREIPGRLRRFAFVMRRLEKMTASGDWCVRQYKPPREYEMSRKEWPLSFKIQGKRAR